MKNAYGWFEVGVEALSLVMQILNFIIGEGIMVVDPSLSMVIAIIDQAITFIDNVIAIIDDSKSKR